MTPRTAQTHMPTKGMKIREFYIKSHIFEKVQQDVQNNSSISGFWRERWARFSENNGAGLAQCISFHT
jgi:hypothetical protein